MNKRLFYILLAALSTSAAFGQGDFFADWEARATRTQSAQPGWAVPVVAPYPMLIQVFRFDATRQITPTLTSTWNHGAGRGLNLIPGFNSEFDVYYPPYVQHNSRARDGFGDVGFLYKYRIASGNEKRGNYMLSAQVSATVPTGTYTNGSRAGSVSPALLAGKGWRRMDVISSLGGTLPTSQTKTLGRTIGWNTTVQYHVGRYLWPEVEDNATYFFGGGNDGKMQNFLTPGVNAGKFKLHPKDAKSRSAVMIGTAMQIATSSFHSYNHELVLTARFLF